MNEKNILLTGRYPNTTARLDELVLKQGRAVTEDDIERVVRTTCLSAWSGDAKFRKDCLEYTYHQRDGLFPPPKSGFPLLNAPQTDSSARLWPSQPAKDKKQKLQEWRDARVALVESGNGDRYMYGCESGGLTEGEMIDGEADYDCPCRNTCTKCDSLKPQSCIGDVPAVSAAQLTCQPNYAD